MIYSRKRHWQFLEEELIAQTEAFNRKVETSATYMLQESGEIFVGMFLSFKESGEMVMKFSNQRPLPRKGEHLFCMTLPQAYCDYHKWEGLTYGDLIRNKTDYSEIVCVWQSASSDPNYNLVGFRGMELEFIQFIMDSPGAILVMGPSKPPYEYIANLQSLVTNTTNLQSSSILDSDYVKNDWSATLLNQKINVAAFLINQLSLTDTVILQGPPGTGKTFLIAELCERICQNGYSVLVTALTNRALMEISLKPSLQTLLKQGRVYKTNLTIDESKECPDLQPEKALTPKPGCIELGTYFITSGLAKEVGTNTPFDFVIMDEASQALLSMFAASKSLGRKNLWIGDVRQMPPVVELNEDRLTKSGYTGLVNGLETISNSSNLPIFQLSDTYRLFSRAAKYTSFFYGGNLQSVHQTERIEHIFGKEVKSGPILIKTDLPIGDVAPKAAMMLCYQIVSNLIQTSPRCSIAVLSCMVKTTKELQKVVHGSIKNNTNIIVETVARVQGLTSDETVFVIPNASMNRSLEPRLFNVSTSRAKNHTFIIADKDVVNYPLLDNKTRQYLCELDRDCSIYIPFTSSNFLMENVIK